MVQLYVLFVLHSFDVPRMQQVSHAGHLPDYANQLDLRGTPECQLSERPTQYRAIAR